MEDPQLQDLINRINELAAKQNAINAELQSLKRTALELQQSGAEKKIDVAFPPTQKTQPSQPLPTVQAPTEKAKTNPPPVVLKPKERTQWEEFIGTNLLNKVGIGILVLGISIGVKYAIDHDMLNPLTRIILGYLAGGGIIAFALRLKKEFPSFSAVLLSGGMASLYFITFAAYDFYRFIPQLVAFIVMAGFTAFTVFAAMQYNLQVISVIGLVGAYAVPFLLSDGSGRVHILFSYMAIINIGILTIAFKRNWRLLFWSAFSLTWLIFSTWVVGDYSADFFWLALSFATAFFIIFYLAFLVGQLSDGKTLSAASIIAVLLNCVCYYGFGYYFISDYPDGELYLGLFTVFNALIHFGVCLYIYRQLSESKDSFYFVAGLVLVFITIAVPVQLEGNWVTLAWALQTAVLFWIGRSKNYPVYELLSYPMAALTLLSLSHDWQQIRDLYFNYSSDQPLAIITPVFNINYLTSLLVAAMCGFIFWITLKHPKAGEHKWLNVLAPLAKHAFSWIGVVVVYIACYQQISLYFQNEYAQSLIDLRGQNTVEHNYDWLLYQTLCLIHYSIIFFAALWYVNRKKMQNQMVDWIVMGLNVLTIISFLTAGLDSLKELTFSYLAPSRFYTVSSMNIAIRYISYLFVAIGLLINFQIAVGQKPLLQKFERLFCHFSILTLLSSWMLSMFELNHVSEGVQLALSILWGTYALYLIIWGFAKDQKFLRMAGIALFGITIAKLFFIDLREMGTIARTLVLMVLGVLLLVASFVYNKHKKREGNSTIDLGKE